MPFVFIHFYILLRILNTYGASFHYSGVYLAGSCHAWLSTLLYLFCFQFSHSLYIYSLLNLYQYNLKAWDIKTVCRKKILKLKFSPICFLTEIMTISHPNTQISGNIFPFLIWKGGGMFQDICSYCVMPRLC